VKRLDDAADNGGAAEKMTNQPAAGPPLAKGSGKTENVPLGILCMLTATIVFQMSSALSKWLIGTYPIGEMLFVRAVSSLVVASLVILPVSGLSVFHTRRLHDHLFRNISQSTAQTFVVIAMSMMPLASVVAITFSGPLFSTIAARVVLKESVGPMRWGVLVVGFMGVLVVTSPGLGTFQVGSLFAIANAVLFGTVAVGVRRMASTESTATLIMYQMVMLTVFFAAFLPFGWVTPAGPRDWGAMILNGLANAAGQYLWTRALHLAPASAVAPFNYFSLVWAIVLGFLVWGDVPTVMLLTGSSIVVTSGLFLLWHEARKRRLARP
jgi:drug/metabolite transporter (DMT)-like permease